MGTYSRSNEIEYKIMDIDLIKNFKMNIMLDHSNRKWNILIELYGLNVIPNCIYKILRRSELFVEYEDH